MKGFRDYKLSTKVFVVVVPLFIVTFGVTVYINYRSQERTVLELAQSAAEAQANIIKKSLVHMMVKNQEVDDKYLAQIGQMGGEIENLQVLFHADSLHLFDEYATPERMNKLHTRESRLSRSEFAHAIPVFDSGLPTWTMTCDVSKHWFPMEKHDDYRLMSFKDGIPLKFWSCGRLKVVLPFKAEGRCQNCHDVPEGHILGAASMEIPFGTIIEAMRSNALRSIVVYLTFIVVASLVVGIIFRRFVATPVNRLVNATEVIGSGNLDHPVADEFDHDELGKLAKAFDTMQAQLNEAQKEIIKKERLSTIGQMASSIIHDFRNPMTSIATTLQFLELKKNLADEQKKDLFKLIRSSVDRMARMTQELLDFSRGEVTLDVHDTDIGEFIREIQNSVQPHLERHNIRFIVRQEFDGTATFDKDRLQRGIINIINNAEDAMPKGGEITLAALSDNGTIVFKVKDTGSGIPEPIRERVFDAFVTAGKTKGTGLGLAITKKIVEQHGGQIYFETATGQGTTFFITLPMTDQNT